MNAAFRYLVILCLTYMISCSSKKDGIHPELGAITEFVYASIKIRPDSAYQVYANVSGIIEENMVEEGDEVKRGEALIRIRNESPELNLDNARLAYEKAWKDLHGENNALEDLKTQIKTARLEVKDDSINFVRQKRLWDQKIGKEIDFEKKELAYELSRQKLQNLRSQYTRFKSDLEIRCHEAENNLELARLNMTDYTVTSKINGKVYLLNKEPGEKVGMQEPLATIGSSGHFIVEMLVDERDIARLEPGQIVTLTLEAYDDQVFTAGISKIYPQKDERNQSFRVEALFGGEKPETLYAGLSGEANILIEEKDSILTIPASYLLEDGSVLTDQGEVSVEVGLRNLDRVEILSGIDENTRIYLPK